MSSIFYSFIFSIDKLKHEEINKKFDLFMINRLKAQKNHIPNTKERPYTSISYNITSPPRSILCLKGGKNARRSQSPRPKWG